MLEKVDLTRAISKEEYKARLPALQTSLYDLQLASSEAGLPSVIVFEGWEAAGKGTCINVLTSRLEPRAVQAARDSGAAHARVAHAVALPLLGSAFRTTGNMAIFDRSWYPPRAGESAWRKLRQKPNGRRPIATSRTSRRTLADDGYAMVKLFFHIGEKEQNTAISAKLEKNPLTRWQVQKADWKRHKEYDKSLVAVEEMLERTESEWGRGPLWRPPTGIGPASRSSKPLFGH